MPPRPSCRRRRAPRDRSARDTPRGRPAEPRGSPPAAVRGPADPVPRRHHGHPRDLDDAGRSPPTSRGAERPRAARRGRGRRRRDPTCRPRWSSAEFWAQQHATRRLRTHGVDGHPLQHHRLFHPGPSTIPGSRGTSPAAPSSTGVRLPNDRVENRDGMRVRLSHNGARTSRGIPRASQQANRVVAVTQPFTDAFDPGRVDAHHPERRPAHARTVAPPRAGTPPRPARPPAASPARAPGRGCERASASRSASSEASRASAAPIDASSSVRNPFTPSLDELAHPRTRSRHDGKAAGPRLERRDPERLEPGRRDVDVRRRVPLAHRRARHAPGQAHPDAIPCSARYRSTLPRSGPSPRISSGSRAPAADHERADLPHRPASAAPAASAWPAASP